MDEVDTFVDFFRVVVELAGASIGSAMIVSGKIFLGRPLFFMTTSADMMIPISNDSNTVYGLASKDCNFRSAARKGGRVYWD